MSKRYNIRWNESDQQALSRAVKNFNAKISRLEKKDPQNKTALPERVSVKQLKELIDTRQDLNREISSLERFTRRGAEELVSIPDNDYSLKLTKWQFHEMNRRNAIINQKRIRRAKKFLNLDMKQGSEDLGYKLKDIGMGKAEEVALQPTTAFTPKSNLRDIHKKYKHYLKESQSTYFDRIDERFRETYIKTLTSKYNKEDITEVIEAIENMDYADFYEEIQKEGGVKAALEWAYPAKPGTAEYNGYVEQLHDKWIPDWWDKRYEAFMKDSSE